MAIGVNGDGVNCIERLRIAIAENGDGVNYIEEVKKWQQV